MGLPRAQSGADAVWVIVDRLTKSAHFLPVQMTWSLGRLTQMYLDKVVRLHSVPVLIISDIDPRFVSRFLRSLQTALGTNSDSAHHSTHRLMDSRSAPFRLSRICWERAFWILGEGGVKDFILASFVKVVKSWRLKMKIFGSYTAISRRKNSKGSGTFN